MYVLQLYVYTEAASRVGTGCVCYRPGAWTVANVRERRANVRERREARGEKGGRGERGGSDKREEGVTRERRE